MKINTARLKILFISFLLCSNFLMYSQSPPVWIGIQGGPAYTSFRGNEWTEDLYDPSMGFMTGISLDHHFSPVFSFVSSLNFEQKGMQGTFVGTDENGQVLGDIEYRAKYQYVTWPLLARATFGNEIQFFFNGGPFMSFLLKQNEKMEATWTDQDSESDNTEDFKKLDYGLVAGIGSIIPVNDQFRITIELRDHLGLINISDLEIKNDGAIKTNAVYFLVGVNCRLGGGKAE